jgi:Fe-S cluster assembly scaffold protein SufB
MKWRIQLVETVLYISESKSLYFVFDHQNIQQHNVYRCIVQAPVELKIYCIILHASSTHIDCIFDVHSAGAHVQLYSLYALSGNESLHIRTFQNHFVPGAQSVVTLHGIVSQKAQCDFYGSIDIAKTAQQTQAHMEHKAIIMESTARVSAQPTIQVHTNNVSCGHGSASGPFDEEQIYFLMARGCTKQDAQKIVLRAFFEEILAQYPDKSSILASIEKKIL